MKSLADKDLLGVILSTQKMAATGYTTLVLESANQSLRNDAITVLQNTFNQQKQLFDFMSQKGWYQTEAASRQEIDKARNQLSGQSQQM